MTIGITEDHAALAAATAAFLARVAPVTDTRGRAADIARGMVPPSWKAVADQGLAGIHLPEAAGGGGGGPVELAVVLEEAGRHLLSGPLLPTATVGAVLAGPRLAGETAPALRALAGGTTAATMLTSAAVTAEPERDGWALTGTARPVLGLTQLLGRCARRPGARSSMRCSSTTCSCPTTASSGPRTPGGAWPGPPWPTSGCRWAACSASVPTFPRPCGPGRS